MAERDRLVWRARDGSFRLELSAEERAMLNLLVDQLDDIVDTDDPTVRRLFPTAYPHDAAHEAEYRSLVHDSLVDGRRRNIAVMRSTLDEAQLDEAQTTSWMHAVGDLRLALGTRLDVAEDAGFDPDHPEAPLLAVYSYLGWLMEHLVEALEEAL